ncbi:hypothetical protein [Paenibacillus alginolyticus]|nr:hypothetical protein [Paenibacillus alginolyticus]
MELKWRETSKRTSQLLREGELAGFASLEGRKGCLGGSNGAKVARDV